MSVDVYPAAGLENGLAEWLASAEHADSPEGPGSALGPEVISKNDIFAINNFNLDPADADTAARRTSFYASCGLIPPLGNEPLIGEARLESVDGLVRKARVYLVRQTPESQYDPSKILYDRAFIARRYTHTSREAINPIESDRYEQLLVISNVLLGLCQTEKCRVKESELRAQLPNVQKVRDFMNRLKTDKDPEYNPSRAAVSAA